MTRWRRAGRIVLMSNQPLVQSMRLRVWLVKADGSNSQHPYELDAQERREHFRLEPSDWSGPDPSALLRSLQRNGASSLGNYQYVIVEVAQGVAEPGFAAGVYTPPVTPEEVMDKLGPPPGPPSTL